jgi:sigma-B regulation protein RsbU (phosphoserine phosphatase)
MKVLGSASIPVSAGVGTLAGRAPTDGAAQPAMPPAWPAGQRAGLQGPAAAEDPFGRIARLAAMMLGMPLAFVTICDDRPSSGRRRLRARDIPDAQGPAERALSRRVIESADQVMIDDARLDPRTSAGYRAEQTGMIAWAGFPVHDPDGHVVGALCVAGCQPRRWSPADVEILQTLALVAAGEVALQVAVEYGAERAMLARTLQESLLPPRLPEIPGLQVAARYAAGGTGAEVLGDFYDVFPSVRGSWGMAVGDVCGKGVAAAKSTALARYTLRAEAHRETRPSTVLAALNQALLDWLTDDPRFLTAIYATVRPTLAGATVRISSAGHPLALVRRAAGQVHTAGRPGTLLGLFPQPELHDAHTLMRPGDSLVMFTDGVTEARRPADRDLFGDDRLRAVIAGLGDEPAAGIADAVQQAILAFSGAAIGDDSVALVLKVPPRARCQAAG